ncbi:hypothetical protein GCM10023208_05450 [Erythrobacter westpacificensis]|uniref:Helix-turn-helix domain-containing protein n=1 Tax=Erythrobacter westpacificensis TaxID=1055231 RepID=A0ABP9K3K9_9SPHN
MGKRRNRNRINAKGRNVTSRFVRLDYRILTSNAYRALSPNARSLLVEVAMLYNGDNNGSLYLGVRDAAHRLGVADLTAASRAFDDLMVLGFLQMTQDAHFAIKAGETSRARCWRLTWLSGPGRKLASWDFLEREPTPKSPSRKRMERGLRALKAYRKARAADQFPVLDINTIPANSAIPTASAVAESNTTNDEIGGNLPILRIPKSNTHLATPWVRGRSGLPIGWWQPDWSTQFARLAYANSLARAPDMRTDTCREVAT